MLLYQVSITYILLEKVGLVGGESYCEEYEHEGRDGNLRLTATTWTQHDGDGYTTTAVSMLSNEDT